jgi:hypothetical protein
MKWLVPQTWRGETVFILGGGPSLKGFDASVLRGHGKVIAVNDSWRLAPWCDCIYFTDPKWFVNALQADKWAEDRSSNFGQVVYKRLLVNGSNGDPFFDHPQVKQLSFSGSLGLETNATKLRHGSNSVYAAMNLAYHFGVSRIVLLGVDMKLGEKGRTHWHNEQRESGFENVLRQSMLPKFQSLVTPLKLAGVEVLNANMDSALECWPKVPLEQILHPVADQAQSMSQASAAD